MNTSYLDIGYPALALGYLLLSFPLALALWLRAHLAGRLLVAVLRMTVQLLFVGFYLQFIFDLNHWAVNLAWLVVMITVADLSVIRSTTLRLRPFLPVMALALLAGTFVPLLYFVGVILQIPDLLEAQYAIPIGGMILGNCLRADIVGIGHFFTSLRKQEPAYLLALAQGANRREAVRPFMREAFQAALAPSMAGMATIGLVSLPGMMTGILMAGAAPAAAIKYQIAIMLAIFTGTAITVVLGISLSVGIAFQRSGVLNRQIFHT